MSKLPEQDLEALIGLFERSDWREMHLRLDGVELVLSKDREPRLTAFSVANAAQPPPSPTPAPAVAAAEVPSAKAAPEEVPHGWVQVKAPTLGTFYRSPKPGAPPFIEVGQRVEAGTELCLVEVMKLFTTVRAGHVGTVRKIYAADAELVEFEQPLFLLEP